MSRGGLGRNDPYPCGSGKKYKKCCYPRTFPDFSKPNAGIPDPYRQQAAIDRAVSRLDSRPPQDQNVTIDTVDVGRTRLLCAPLAPYGDGVALPGTLAPPTPLQVEAKYKEIRKSNPDGVTEVVVTYTYPEMFGIAEARMVFDADEHFELLNGRVVSVLDLFRGMNTRIADGSIGAIVGNPQRRYDIPVPPLPDERGLWSSRVVGRVKHTAHEIVEFHWAGEMVRVTPGHAVWSQSRCGWVGAHELFRGEMIRVAGNVVAPVEAARRIPGMIEVFGIEIEYFHNYFVGRGPNAMLVHNGPECVVRPREASGKKAGAGRAGLSEDPSFAAGYEAIFGKKGAAQTELPLKAPRDKFKYPKHADSKPFSPEIEPGDYVFVRDRNGVVHVVKETEGHLHPKILGSGESVSGAGGIKVGPGGKILEIDNASGTFRFKPNFLEQVKEALGQQGANVADVNLKPFKN